MAVAAFMIVLVVSVALGSRLTMSSSTITVPDEYPSIQEAINAAHEGDTVYVKAGQYVESITVNKTVNLVGEDRATTIIDGNVAPVVVLVQASCVNISGFTIQNGLNNILAIARIAGGHVAGGIGLNASVGCTVRNNTIQGCAVGVAICTSSSNTTVSDNSIVRGNYSGMCAYGVWIYSPLSPVGGNMISNNNMTFGTGVWVVAGQNNVITGNRFDCRACSIQLGMSSLCGNNVVSENTATDGDILVEASQNNVISDNTVAGSLFLDECSNNTLRENSFSSFGVEGSELSHFLHDIDTSNTVNGRPIYYLVNQSNLLIDPFTHPSVGYLGLVNSRNMSLWRLTITNNTQGLMLAQTTGSEISEIHLSNDKNAIYMWNCSEDTIMGSTITLSGQPDARAIDMQLCTKNMIIGNTLLDNVIGVHLVNSTLNTFSRNNFFNSSIRLEDNLSNAWDDGGLYKCPVCGNPRPVGNYWSDYSGQDDGSHVQAHNCPGDGIGGTQLPNQGVDYYPLMKPWVPVFGDLDYNGIVNILDLAKAAKNFGKTSP
jgi:parallel beta-helix repeat protein